jgi:hypothetical protein
MNEPSATQSRWAGMGEVLKRIVLGAVAAAVAVGLLGAIIAWASGRSVSSMMAAAYYIVGCILFLLGMFPSGGFSMFRGTLTRRKPTGSQQEPIFLLGIVLIGLGVLVDVTSPF